MNGDACRYTFADGYVAQLHMLLVRDGVLGSSWDESKLCLVGDGYYTTWYIL
jgi:hypothetical protein